jgi:hypothetical protein
MADIERTYANQLHIKNGLNTWGMIGLFLFFLFLFHCLFFCFFFFFFFVF